ncbi:MAG: L-fuculose-phosphate aldolase [Clostridia bacterium]|nr:L-fuculose-phosphate aldolase [Clostridia bacterium]
MLMEKERSLVVEYGKKLITNGLTTGTGGNISIFDSSTGLMAISPSGVDYFETTPADVVVMRAADHEKLDGDMKPSSEYRLHSIFYQNRPDVRAVVHTHSPYATALATLGEGLPASSYLVAFAGPDVRCAPYRTYGTAELASAACEYMEGRNCVLLANHGLVAGAGDIKSAFHIAMTIEECCRTYQLARSMGKPLILPEDEMRRLMEKFKSYGQ